MTGRGGADRLALYKGRGAGARRVEERRKQVITERKQAREQRRTQAFTTNRGLPSIETGPISREQKLKEWKRKKELSRETTKKPPFVFKKIAYNDQHLYKPPESTTFRPPLGVKPVQNEITGRVLRARTRLQQNAPVQAVRDVIKDFASGLTSVSKKGAKSKNKPSQITKSKANNGEAEILNSTFDGPSTSTGCDTNTTETHVEHEPSPSQLNKDLQTNPNELTVQKSAEYFRTLHSGAVSKLNDLCQKWTTLQSQGLPQAVHDDVDVSVGYAQLLISSKLQQFEGLIAKHENAASSTDLKVLSTDLDGFWSLVFLEVEDMYRKFGKLEEMAQNNWTETTVKPLPVNRAKVQKAKVVKLKGNASSNLRSFIASARQKARIEEVENTNPLGSVNIEGVFMPKPMSPIVMRISSMAKQFGSPKVAVPLQNELRSPLCRVNRQEDGRNPIDMPTSIKKTPRRGTNYTPGLTPLRRSTRILSQMSSP